MQATDHRLSRPQKVIDSPFTPHASPLPTNCSSLNYHSSLITLLLAVLIFFLFFYLLGERDLWSSHEGRAAQDAEMILEDGNWGLPRLFDHKYVDLQKPPLYYWLVAGVAWIRSQPVDAWAVRLPSALAAAGCCLLLFWFGSYRGRMLAGIMAALILATAVHFTWLARIGRIDMPLTLAISCALICLYLGWQSRNSILDSTPGANATGLAWPWFLGSYLSVALAVLLKGPIGLVLPTTVVASWLLMEGELSPPWRIRSWLTLAHRLGLWWGLPLVLVIAGPWFFWAAFQTDGALEQSLWYHNVVRAVGGIEKMRARPLLFYIPRLAMDFLPWSVLLPVAAWYVFRRGKWRIDAEARFGVVWLLSVIAILSCVGFKRADYLVPAYPGAALFLGCVGERWIQAVRRPALLAKAFGVVVASCVVGWSVYLTWILPREEAEREDRTFAAAVRRYAPAPDPVIFFRVEAHTLAFHTGRPVDTLLEWENLDFWAGQPRSFYVVMEPECAREWPDHLHRGTLEPVTSNVELAGGKHEHPLLLLRTRPFVKELPTFGKSIKSLAKGELGE
jgi:4-amino-4-deoxy-L-arabinose transferase-like glycosyltransferase